MPKTHRPADDADRKLLDAVLEKWHEPLVRADVTVGLLYATGGLSHGGYPVAAHAKINNQRDRVEGKPDCTITVNHDTWTMRPDAEKVAILDHEANHFEVVTEVNDEGETVVAVDDCFRPKLASRKHTVFIGGFDCIIERHGAMALEAQQIHDAQRLVAGLFAPKPQEKAVAG